VLSEPARIIAIGTAVPTHDIHHAFIDWAAARLADPAHTALFKRMAARSGINHRYSVLPIGEGGGSPIAPGGFYEDATLPPTSARMALYGQYAPALAMDAVAALAQKTNLDGITHLVVASCTGFVAPGIDQVIAREMGLSDSVERLLVGFMGCYAATAARAILFVLSLRRASSLLRLKFRHSICKMMLRLSRYLRCSNLGMARRRRWSQTAALG
jgi:alpha-pyrone synthase